jgi:FKBP-type peptidyl-prolyl cis-trans isomerase 2
MMKRGCVVILCVFLALPVYAGNGTIEETEAGMVVEFSGDDNDILAGKRLKEEQRIEEEQKQIEEKIKQQTAEIRESQTRIKEERRIERRNEEAE